MADVDILPARPELNKLCTGCMRGGELPGHAWAGLYAANASLQGRCCAHRGSEGIQKGYRVRKVQAARHTSEIFGAFGDQPCRICVAAMIAMLGICFAGCAPKPFSGTVNIAPTAKFKEQTGLLPTIELDVIGVNAIELQRWKSYPVDNYWTPGNSFRGNASRASYLMTTSNPGPFQVGSWTSQRNTWMKAGATSLVLIANLPGAWRSRPPTAKGPPPPGVHWYEGKDDPRRLIVPWTQGAYGMFTNTVDIDMSPDGLRLLTLVNMSGAVPAAGS